MQVQKRANWTVFDGVVFALQSSLPDVVGTSVDGAAFGGVLSVNFHLEHFIGGLPIAHFGVGHKGDEPFLEGAEAPLNLPLGLGCGCDQVGDAQGAQGPLELALGVGMVAGRTGAKEAEPVSIDGFWDAVALKNGAEMAEVVPGRVGFHKAPSEVQSGVVINGQKQHLFGGSWPPLVDGTVMLP